VAEPPRATPWAPGARAGLARMLGGLIDGGGPPSGWLTLRTRPCLLPLAGITGTLVGVGLTLFAQVRNERRRTARDEVARLLADCRSAYATLLTHFNLRRQYMDNVAIYWNTPILDDVMAARLR
jgi:hypothetical protein